MLALLYGLLGQFNFDVLLLRICGSADQRIEENAIGAVIGVAVAILVLGLRLFTACDHYGRNLARNSEQYQHQACSDELFDAVTGAAGQIQRNIEALIAALGGARDVRIAAASDSLDAAESLARQHDGDSGRHTRRLLSAVNSLRRIGRAVVAAATHLGVDAGLALASQAPR
ncbi:MAG: hypothetical protein QOH91_2271 [Mycobacterium sp.]|jgi:uncharacterized membrane protein YccC|nr:hypothetical protein [Mycobacterium sp.]